MKTKPVKARKMPAGSLVVMTKTPIFVIPADAESFDRMRVQAGEAIQRWLNGYALPAKYPTVADAALASLGLTRPAPKEKN